ncbi:MAG TPA: UDP-N-acetylmuramoyl-L-alanyl-D-glutamate--2,6-diaminopimelate ligase, partial [Syntrophorhabdaceae bacterium]|nr:UDP-N-acetylmuramoyl-L-alanyl-D-glutamate--2,6-diaminopimelate ligase [Syntrophorhabdaceae bacterium]
MKLKELVKDIDMPLQIKGDLDLDITGLTKDSRKVKKGFLFFLTGGGISFVEDALKNGATGIVSDKKSQYGFLCHIKTEDPNRLLGKLSARFYGCPSDKLHVTGITGTNGKTTTTYLIESILKENGNAPGVIGTITYRYKGHVIKADNTTPGAEDLQRLLKDMHTSGVDHAVMEVSSHGLDQRRVEGIEFDVGIFTNLTHDHLDYHKDFIHYKEAKRLLFHYYLKESKKKARHAILNLDDPYASEFVPESPIKTLFYSLEKNADAHIIEYSENLDGLDLYVSLCKEDIHIHSRLIGYFNAYNILASCLFGIIRQIPIETIKRGIEGLESVPGRMERIKNKKGYPVFVDYAHTPDALSKAIGMLNRLKKGRLIVIFGCGGNRDTEKRPLMGNIATTLADFVIITSDNPRKEDPKKIIEDIKGGIKGENYRVIENRRDAIIEGISMLQEEDCLLIAGKGHEDYQIIGDEIFHFSDKEVVEELLNVDH